MKRILLDKQDEAVRCFFLSLPADAEGCMVELNGVTVACVVLVSSLPEDDGVWTVTKNERRCNLVDRDIDGCLTPTEAVELVVLQQAMLKFRSKIIVAD